LHRDLTKGKASLLALRTYGSKGQKLYAILLGWPENGKVLIRSIAASSDHVIQVSMLGSKGTLAFDHSVDGLFVTLHPDRLCKDAFVLEIICAWVKANLLASE